MEIFIAKNKENWPNQGFFAQGWEWGKVLLEDGQKVERLLIKDGETLVGAQIVYKSLPFGWSYAFCPKGPVTIISNFQFSISNQFPIFNVKMYEALADYLRKQKCIFLRCEPQELPKGVKVLKTKDINPRTTVILDLNKSEEEILAGMKKNTRYSIRFAEKQNLMVKKENNLEIFWKLLRQTAARDKFSTHSKEHYQHVLVHPEVWQLTAYQAEMPVASAIFIGSGDTITYLFAASDYSRHHLLAPYLIQWEAIKIAKKMGYKYYDFFGIAPGKETQNTGCEPAIAKFKIQNLEEQHMYDIKHQYAGITRFKLGFGGIIQSLPGTFEVVLDKKKYWVYKILRFLYGIRKIGR